MSKMYELMAPQWEYVSDCYKGVIAIKSPEKMHVYLPKFPVEERTAAKEKIRIIVRISIILFFMVLNSFLS